MKKDILGVGIDDLPLEEAVAALHANQISVYLDTVMNQKTGADYTERFMACEVDPHDRRRLIGEPVEVRYNPNDPHEHYLPRDTSGKTLAIVLTLVGVMLEMAYVGDVAHVAHLISEPREVTKQDVESDGGTRMTKMRVAIDCRAAHIHAHMPRLNRGKGLLDARQRVIEHQPIGLNVCVTHLGR